MNKVIFSTAAALALAVVFTGVVSASSQYGGGYDRDRNEGNVISVENEDTFVKTEAEAKADTGDNEQIGTGGSMGMTRSHHSGKSSTPTQKMITGDAWAGATSFSDVNTTYLPSCGCFVSSRQGRHGSTPTTEIKVENEDTKVITEAEAEAETGENEQTVGGSHPQPKSFRYQGHGSSTGGVNQIMKTGGASAESYAQAWVNMTDMRVAH